jgi:signal transduction histidine kinase
MVLVTAAAVAVFAVPLGAAAARLYLEREETRLEHEATRFSGVLVGPDLLAGETIKLPRMSSKLWLGVYDEQGRKVAGRGPAVGGEEVSAALQGQVIDGRTDQWLAVAIPIHDEGRVVGAVRAAAPWHVVADAARVSWMVMVVLGLLAIGLAAALGWWLSSRLAAPVHGLSRLAVRLGDGDFSARYAPAGVTELDEAGEALNRTAGRLGDTLTRERQFTADVSHQLATPLTSLRLGLESALMNPDDDGRETMATSLAEVERLQATVATLLAVARDAHPPTTVGADVAPVCEEVVERCREALAREGRPLRLDVQPDLPAVRCPPDVVREILSVLVDNAQHHGGGAVTVTGRSAGRGVVLEVSDEGPGITGNPGTLFERRAPTAAGHGIGLSLAKSLAETHEARLQLRRAAPHPAFTLALPGVDPSGNADSATNGNGSRS